MNTRSLILAAAAAALLAGCASAPTNPRDPLEPMNRAVFRFNDAADRAVAKPVAQAYRDVTPQPVRTAVSNFFDNLRDAYSVVSNTLRAEPEKALNDTLRVAMNSTFGLFGLIDIATPAGLKNNKNTLGDTFASWGWKNSSYLVLPLLGPSTVRDGAGLGVYVWFSPERNLYKEPAHANVATGLNLLSRREQLLGLEGVLDDAALDPYAYTRDAFLQVRDRSLGLAPADGDDMNIDAIMGETSSPPPKADASAPVAPARPDASAAK
ncbi:MlaA family lipoprotein [Paludibacterium paludis]|uniref:ABC transporter n=1 Tax=Paludibacterium paludis TaxID=1225769 RepID=A0A918P6Q1_9NEIS|nr:VacJ family lipoprotein [Paludibacterium paludis]GGY29123.1 ABC transporter [Paludibacterium paludis]